jgi:integrase
VNAKDDTHQFLDTLAIGRDGRVSYASVVRAFETAVRGPAGVARTLSRDTLRAWLRAERGRRSFKSVMFRVSVIARYLDWQTSRGGDPNPLATLRETYGQRMAPIVRALLERDDERALAQLRPLPKYGSTLGPLILEHVARKQSLGLRYDREADLLRFDRFLQGRSDLAGQSLSVLLDAWRHSTPGVRHELRVQQCGRALSQALYRRDMTTPILSIEAGLQRRVSNLDRKPYIFTEAEVDALFHAARTFPSRNAPLLPIALYAMLTVAYCAGLRLGEIAALTLGDLDPENGLLEIRDTKFFKSRRLPLTPSVIEVLSGYLKVRAATGAPSALGSPLWWSGLRRRRYSYSQIDKLLTRVIQRAGLKPALGKCGPRVHDVRHTFVAHRMVRWYRDGVDVQNRLPYLATYLGHKDIQSTLVYLNVTPELLQQASERYRQHGVGALRASGDRT